MVPRETTIQRLAEYTPVDESLSRTSRISVRPDAYDQKFDQKVDGDRESYDVVASRAAKGIVSGSRSRVEVRESALRRGTHEEPNTTKGSGGMVGQEQEHLSAVTYTDTPTRISVLPEGRFLMPADSNVFLSWTMNRIQIPETSTPLSIRWVTNGLRYFEMQGARSVIDEGSYLLLNAGQTSSSEIDSSEPVQCYTVCFRPGMAEEVLGALITPQDRLLDEPGTVASESVTFVDRVYPHDERVSSVLARLVSSTVEYPTYGWFEDQFHLLLTQMLAVHRDVIREMEALPAVRIATRVELYRRLYRAREFMEANLEQSLTLTEIAQVAWFSPFHFLRLFKGAFGETPHQYLMHRRIERAKVLLRKTDMPVTEICYSVGFESLGSFSGLFRREVGMPPVQYRKRRE